MVTSKAILSALVLLSAPCLANFDGQVTSIMSWINMNEYLLAFGTDPGEYQVIDGNPADITTSGVIQNDSTSPLAVVSNDIFPISNEPGIETHFQFILDFKSTKTTFDPVGPLGSNEDPSYGCLMAGATNFTQTSYFFALTNTKVYAILTLIDDWSTWAIPICNRIPDDVRLYTIAIKRGIGRVAFRINNVDKVEVPGYCGIDNRFLIHGTGGGCSPSLDATKTLESAQVFIFCGPYSGASKGFCLRSRYQMCENNISFASGCRCQYQANTTVPAFDYVANIGLIEVITMGRTNRCDGDSSSSEHRNWWECKPDCCNGPVNPFALGPD